MEAAIHYERNGNVFGFSKELVERIERGNYSPGPQDDVNPIANQRQQSVPVEVLDEALKLTDPSGLDDSDVIRDGQLDQRRLTSIENEFRLNPASAERRLSYQKALQDVVHWQIKRNDLRLGSVLD